MEFSTFLAKISQKSFLDTTKNAANQQLEMVPKERLQFDLSTIKNPKQAAVLALFYPNSNNETCFLLTLRANYKGTHAAQISFPGGKKELSDKNLKETALRETQEEVGISSKEINIIKQLHKTYIPPSNFWVSPFIGFSKETPKFIKNYEVEKLIDVKIEDLLNPKNRISSAISTSYGKNITVPCFILNQHVVWGATAMILNEIKYLFGFKELS